MSLFHDQAAEALGVLKDLAGDKVDYFDGSGGSVNLTAIEGKHTYETTTEQNIVIDSEAPDFVIDVADLVIATQAVEPKPGHWIIKNGNKFVLAALGNERCYRFTDPSRTRYRIHTLEV